jgi:predicted RNase H-like HicB family nuclease
MEARMKLKVTEELWKEGNMYVSYCPELDVASCGETVDQAKKNLKEVILINLEEAQKLGSLDQLLQEAGFGETDGVLASRKELVGFTPIEVTIPGKTCFAEDSLCPLQHIQRSQPEKRDAHASS